jgi:hypothetical protein
LRKSKFFSVYVRKIFSNLYTIRSLLNIEPLKFKHIKEIFRLYISFLNEINKFNYINNNNNNYIEKYKKDIIKKLLDLVKIHINSKKKMNEEIIQIFDINDDINIINQTTKTIKIENINIINYLKEILEHKFIQNQLKFLMDNKLFVLYFLQDIIDNINVYQFREPYGNLFFMENSNNNSTEYYKNKHFYEKGESNNEYYRQKSNNNGQKSNNNEEELKNNEEEINNKVEYIEQKKSTQKHTLENTEIEENTPNHILLEMMGIKTEENKKRISDYKDEIIKAYKRLVRVLHPNKGGKTEIFQQLGLVNC